MTYKLFISSHRGDGSRTEIPCPKCRKEILYNGNYFCSECEWVFDLVDGVFNVVLLKGLRDCALKAGDTDYAELCNFYLGEDA